MSAPFRLTERFDTRVRRVWLLASAVLLPGIVLAWFGLRSLQHERVVAGEEARLRLDAVARQGASTLERELRRWREVTSELAAAPTAADLGRAFDRVAGGAAVTGPILVGLDGSGLRVIPRERLLYDLAESDSADVRAPRLPEGFAAAEAMELRDEAYPEAIRAYEGLLSHAPREALPTILHRLARTCAKAGRADEALLTFGRLEELTDGRVGSLPAPLVATHSRCTLLSRRGATGPALVCTAGLYDGLLSGRWLLEKARFEYYAAEARAWLDAESVAPVEHARLLDLEARKRTLTGEVADEIEVWRSANAGPAAGHRAREDGGRVWLAFWQVGPTGVRVLLVLPSDYLRTSVWPQTFAGLAEDVDLMLVAPAGSVAYRTTTGSPPEPTTGIEGAGTLRDGDLVWRFHARAQLSGRFAASLATRQRLYLATLILMVVSLVIGSALTARTVRREIQVARMKSQFVSAVSHEFRTPLTSIRQLAELLDRGVPSDERSRQYFKVILHESERLSRLVEHVLDFARMEDGRKEYRFERIDTAPWLAEVIREAERSAAAGGKRIEANLGKGLPPISADRQALASAIHNLLDNAGKYSPDCDTVWIEAGTDSAALVVRVRDLGVGIAPEDRPHVFDRFYRGSQAAATTKGTGLGLSLVKHIVDAHGGTVALDSVPGEGTTVTLRVPAVP